MLIPNFSITPKKGCKSLIFSDTTGTRSDANPGGYGSPNILKTDVTKTALIIRLPDGAAYVLYSTYLPTQAEWEIFSSDLYDGIRLSKKNGCGCESETEEEDDDCGCRDKPYVAHGNNKPCPDCPPISQDFIAAYPLMVPPPGKYGLYDTENCNKPNSLNYFPDGCTQFTYEVYAKTGIPVRKCSYGMSTKLCEGQTVWVNKNNGWYDITESNQSTFPNFSFAQYQTSDVYTKWQVRNEHDKVVEAGSFTVFNCVGDGTTTTSTTDKLVASKTLLIPMTCNVQALLENLSFQLTVAPACETELMGGVNQNQAVSLFALADRKIASIKTHPECGCQCIADTIDSSVKMLTQVIKLKNIDIETCV